MRKRIDRTGEISTNSQGLKMKIVRYGGAKDIDIQFEDGTIMYNKEYKKFKDGSISKEGRLKKAVNERLGEISVNNSGTRMKIVRYRSSKDIDIQLEDGTVLEHRLYKDFKAGKIGTRSKCSNIIGRTIVNKTGDTVRIIGYRSTQSIDVQFEDGVIVRNRTMQAFQIGQIMHPSKSAAKIIGNMYIKWAYQSQDHRTDYYMCECKKCGMRDIMTIEEVKKHRCNSSQQ